MDKATREIVNQIDRVISDWGTWRDYLQDDSVSLGTHDIELIQLHTAMTDIILRFAPKDSAYYKNAQPYLVFGPTAPSTAYIDKECLDPLIGILQSLRRVYQKGYLNSIRELVNAELFSDFLEMCDYYLQEGHKDAAAVILGGVLEEHLRKISQKNCIGLTFQTKKGETLLKKIAMLNDDLAKKGAYTEGYHKQISAWLAIRNNAAHGKYDEYTKDQVQNMLDGMRIFINAHPG